MQCSRSCLILNDFISWNSQNSIVATHLWQKRIVQVHVALDRSLSFRNSLLNSLSLNLLSVVNEGTMSLQSCPQVQRRSL